MKKLINLLLTICLTITLFACTSNELCFESKDLDIYYKTLDVKENVEVYYKDGNNQIPYIGLETYANIMNHVYNEGIGDYPKDVNYKMTVSYDDNIVTLTRENNSNMFLDFKDNSITFDNYDLFIAHSYDESPQELPHMTAYDEEGNPVYIKRVTDKYMYTNGDPLKINLSDYNINLYKDNSNYYVPLQTLADLLINLQYTNILYNKDAIFVIDYSTSRAELGDEPTGLMAKYYEDTTTIRSQELIEYTYNELCMFLDYSYGLKEEHEITNFDSFFKNTYNQGKSLKEYLMSEDAYEFELGMAYLVRSDFNDLHSGYAASSAYALNCGSKVKEEVGLANDYSKIYDNKIKLLELQKEYYPDGMKQYEEIGNTAFIYLSRFAGRTKDYYSEEPTIDAPDSVGVMLYAYKQIYRENSPIENVVLDVSANTGGEEDALCFVCGMFTGEFTFSIVNPITHAVSNSRYRVDANLDHEFDDHDWFYDKNLYCITSPASFSCANICPAILKENTYVTMLGRKSGGGSCIVCPFTTASGGWYQTSSTKSVVRNHLNTYYSVDDGIEVDYRFDTFDDFYNREAIVEYING